MSESSSIAEDNYELIAITNKNERLYKKENVPLKSFLFNLL